MPESDTESPGDRLASALKALEVRQADVARRTKVSTAYVNDLIHGRRSISEPYAEWLQTEYGIDKIRRGPRSPSGRVAR